MSSTVSVTIANGASLSGVATISGQDLLRLTIPTLASAAITFQGSENGTDFYDFFKEDGTEVSLPAHTHNRMYSVPLELFGTPYIKVRSGTSAAPVTQSGGKTIVLGLS